MPAEPNPYSRAAGAYGNTASTTDPRMLEGQILLKAAMKIEDLQTRMKNGENIDFREIGDVLDYNQKLWTVFVSDAGDPAHPLPQEIKNNIASLGLFIFKRTIEVRANPEPGKLQILININRNIAAGLMKRPPGLTAPLPVQQKDAAGSTDSII
jgi:flagellar protein FlaF